MSDLIPKAAPTRKTGLSPKEQKLQALREKLANTGANGKPIPGSMTPAAKANTASFKKASFQRKAT